MGSKALSYLSSSIYPQGSSFAPYGFNRGMPTPTNISNYITPVQFERIAQDIRNWRDAMREMELAWYPMRVKSMRMFIDTVENGYVKAVLSRWKELTTQRDYKIYQVKGGKEIISRDLSQQLQEQTWVGDWISYCSDAQLWGYSLIEMRNIVDDSFPDITFTRRENIRPDGNGNSGPILTSLVYAIDGMHVTEDPLIDLCNHWIPTKSNRGVSSCGYGLLYNIALYEIHLRHILEWNVDYAESYGQPIKKGFTNKTGKERDNFEAFLRNGASSQWILLDKGTNDDVVYEMAKDAGTAWKTYENLENRLQGVISQLVLGHTDAIKSTPGKLGGMQAANKDGFNESLIEQAMNAKQIDAGNFVCKNVNQILAPKMRRLGEYVGSKTIKGLFPPGYTFGLQNDKEENEVKRRTNAQRLVVSEVIKNMNDAGWDIDQDQAIDWFGLNLTKSIPQHELIEKRTDVNVDGTNSIKTGQNDK